mmetsp:Transcript_20984/g.30797  ORF Transcript_20984/g.30797 Transcript_20984/m.30797 type:complete len:132 (-) Transcript_20984:67-462(-)
MVLSASKMMKCAGMIAVGAIVGASAFAPAGLPAPALRQNSNAMSSLHMGKTSYTRNFGYPCADGRGLIDEVAAKAKQNKVDGWIYRKGGEGQEFEDGAKLYKALDAKVAASKVNVRRYHSQKTSIASVTTK